MQEGVEEIDAQKPQIRQPLQEALHAGVADLGHFAGIECFTETDVSVVFMKTGIRLYHMGHSNFRILFEDYSHQSIASDVVHALADVAHPGSLLLARRC